MTNIDVQYVTGADGKQVGVFVPIDEWRDMESKRETAYLMSTEARKQRASVLESGTEKYTSLDEAGIEISERTGLPVFRVSSNGRPITLEDVKKLEGEWWVSACSTSICSSHWLGLRLSTRRSGFLVPSQVLMVGYKEKEGHYENSRTPVHHRC